MLAKGKAPKVFTAVARQEPVADIPEGRPLRGAIHIRKAASQGSVRI
jgi:hypothetical protein